MGKTEIMGTTKEERHYKRVEGSDEYINYEPGQDPAPPVEPNVKVNRAYMQDSRESGPAGDSSILINPDS